jgi:hypothetical protein
LQVHLTEIAPKVGIKTLSKLSHLRKFTFGRHFPEWELDCETILICAQHLPQLKIVGWDFQEVCVGEVVDFEECYFDQVICQPLQLGLEQLVLSRDNFPHKKFSVPDLRELHLVWPRGDVIGLCNRFEGVSWLALYRTDEDLILKVLQSVGRRLTTLVLAVIQKKLSMSAILQLCPCLEKLRIENTKFDMCYSPWPKDITLNCLQEVSIMFDGFILEVGQLPHHFITKVNLRNDTQRIYF